MRLTTIRRLPLKVEQETASLNDHVTVQRWIRALRPESDQQVHVRRPWGSVVAVSDGKHPIGVFLSEGPQTWAAAPPGGSSQTELTLEQVEHVVLDALTASERPQWPSWQSLD